MPRLTHDQWTEIRALRETGVSFPALARTFNLSHQAIQKRAARENWGDGSDVGATVRRKVAEKIAGVADRCNPEKKLEALELAAERGAEIIRLQQQDWEMHRATFGSIPADFETGKHAKISAEMLKLRHDGERRAWNLEPQIGDLSQMTEEQLQALAQGKAPKA